MNIFLSRRGEPSNETSITTKMLNDEIFAPFDMENIDSSNLVRKYKPNALIIFSNQLSTAIVMVV